MIPPVQSSRGDAELSSLLKASELFAGCDGRDLEGLSPALGFLRLAEGEMLFQAGDPGDAMYVVLEGRLAVVQTREDGRDLIFREIGPGETVGERQILSAGNRASTVRSRSYSELIRIPAAAAEQFLRRHPLALRELARTSHRRLREDQLLTMLADLLAPIDLAPLRMIAGQGEWVHLKKDQPLLRRGDPCGCLFLVVSGLLQEQGAGHAHRGRVGEAFSCGELIGAAAIITGEEHTADIAAVRDSELVRFPRAAFQQMVDAFPVIMQRLAQLLVKRLQKIELHRDRAVTSQNIAVIPVHSGVQLREFVSRLRGCFDAGDPTLHVNSRELDALLGNTPGIAQSAGRDYHSIRLSNWLDEQELRHRFIIYEADPVVCPWTERCIARADHIVLVADAGMAPDPGEIERAYPEQFGEGAAVRRTLVLLHPGGTRMPRGTREWLGARKVDMHHHIRRDREEDFARLARFLSGRAVGLVLGGGGARGLAHIGVIRALREAGIPIDAIGGTSMGAIIACQYALGYDIPAMMQKNHHAFNKIKPFKEYTFPILSLVRSRKLDQVADYFCGDHHIEDLWINYFCVSSNLNDAEMAVHRQGLLRKMARASSSIPGVALPVLENGKLLVDGGFFNNLPCDIMRELTLSLNRPFPNHASHSISAPGDESPQ